jgi:hypothetical protein
VGPTSTIDTKGGVRGGSDGDNKEDDDDDGNPLVPIKSPLPPPFRSPYMRRVSGQKHKQGGINTDVSDHLFSLLLLD